MTTFCRLTRRRVVAAAIGVAVALCACSGGRGSGGAASSTSSSAPPDPFATVGVAAGSDATPRTRGSGRPRGSLTVGECFDATTFSAGAPIDPANITLRLCAGPHQHEVYAVLDHPGGTAAPYPGDQTITAYADDRCIAAFVDYVGVAYQLSTLDYATVYPDAASWKAGDRQIACVLHDADFIPLLDSMKNANR